MTARGPPPVRLYNLGAVKADAAGMPTRLNGVGSSFPAACTR